jgi:hypothetical protein
MNDLETVRICAEILYLVITLALLGVFAHSTRTLYKFRKLRVRSQQLDDDRNSLADANNT